MAYFITYQGSFTNRRSNEMRIEIYRKDIDPGTPSTLDNREILDVSTGYPNGNESKYDCIIGSEASITLRVRTGSAITPETFITELYDEWKVLIYCDNLLIFAGFIEPSEGSYLMKDAPQQISIKCTDGSGLLKNTALTDVNGDTLVNQTLTLIELIAGALKKTNLDLPIRIFCSIYESSMTDRTIDPAADMFSQCKLEYRTFLATATSFENCYRALEIILTGNFCLYQWNGMWVISSRSELIGIPGPVMYYTDYDSDGVVIEGAQDQKAYVEIGYDKQQHPINLDQIISYQVPAKSIITQYNYVPWPEIPKNSRFDRGTLITSGTNIDGTTWKTFTIDDVEFGTFTFASPAPFALTAPTGNAYRKSTYNTFGTEILREVIIETPATNRHWIRFGGIPIGEGDKISIDLQKKFSNDFTGGSATNTFVGGIYIIPDSGTDFYDLDNNVGGQGTRNGIWKLKSSTGSPVSLLLSYVEDQNSSVYNSLTIMSEASPISGTLYIVFQAAASGTTGPLQFYTDFNFQYFAFVAGGYIQVKGDQWLTSQDRNVKDTIDDEVYISDSTKKVLKGSLLRMDGSLTTPTWYRLGYDEERHYKEILNLAKFSHYYRRMRKITGTFRGAKSHSVNLMGDFYPICFHKHYAFVDNDVARYYVLVPPLQINYVAGTFSAIAIECYKEGDITTEGDTHEFNYIFS